METKESFVGLMNGIRHYRTRVTESYVEVPPACIITDERGNTWTIGPGYAQHGDVFYWDVMCNDRNMGELARKMVWQGGRLYIWTYQGRKVWNGRSFF